MSNKYYLLTYLLTYCRQTNSVKALKGKKYHIPRLAHPQLTCESSNPVFGQQRLPVTRD